MKIGQIGVGILLLGCVPDGLSGGEAPPLALAPMGAGRALVDSGKPAGDPETLAAWAKVRAQAATFQRRTPRVHVFSRAQLKYGLERDDYLHKWVDRPLFVDPALQGGGSWLNRNSFRKVRENVLAAGLDGLAFFPETTGRSELFDACRLSGLELTILPEFAAPGDLDRKLQIARAALDCPHSFRINGKVVLTSYRPAPVADWQTIQTALRKAYGDQFLLIPSQAIYPPRLQASGPGGQLGAKDIATVQEFLRQTLRVVDGFYYNSQSLRNRRYAAEIDREILLPIVKSVLAEPEFQGKFLGWGVRLGHENLERLGYTFDSTGTGMLRGTFETAILADGDFVNCIEWDEQNENTSFRPTVCNSLSTQRILGHFTNRLKGRPASPRPGDDLTVPNLILSYRKILVAGQALEFEVVNVPDSDEPGVYCFGLKLKNAAGEVVHSFPRRELPRHELSECFLSVPAANFLGEQLLVPELEVQGQSATYVQRDGFHPIELRASWNWDFKWVKQPLRDLLRPESVRMELQPAADLPGIYRLSAAYRAPEPLAYAEVLDSGDTIFAHQGDGEPGWRENEREAVIGINWQSLAGRPFRLNGKIALTGAAGRWLVRNPKLAQQGQVLTFRNSESSHHLREVWVALPRDAVPQAAFEIDLPGIFQGRLPVADVLAREVVAFPAEQSFNLVFRRYVSQTHLPRHLDHTAGEFEILVAPASATSVFSLQLLAKSGKVYRGQPRSVLAKSGATVPLTVHSLPEGKTVKLQVDRSQITTATYLFTPEHGSALVCREGNRGLWGLAGGFRPQIVGRGSGESGYGNPLSGGEDVIALPPEQLARTAPAWERLADGAWALRFSEHAFVSLPQMLIPSFSSFVLSLDVMPDEVAGSQPLLSGGSTAFTLSLRDGLLEGTCYRNETEQPLLVCKTGLRVEAGRWSNIQVWYDQANLQFAVNGTRSRPFPCSGHHRYQFTSSLGYAGGRFFRGRIKSLRVEHRDP